MEENKILSDLLSLADSKYRDFQSKLMPSVPKERIIGIRTPILRKYAAGINGTPEAEYFLSSLPHYYYEENNLHGFLIEKVRDYDKAVTLTEDFLPYVDNWATCDSMSPKVFAKHLPEIRAKASEWIASGKTYTVRYGIGILMRYFLDGDAEVVKGALREVASVKSDEYYINMMCAWFFATALAKQCELALPYFEKGLLTDDVKSKAIRKAIESFRVTDDVKARLRAIAARKA